MTERPILFSAEMVRAILDGRKTQTRRVMKPQPKPTPADFPGPAGHWWPSQKHKSMLGVEREMQKWKGLAGSACPYGDTGDLLWVRETWKPVPISAYRCSEGVQQTPNPQDADEAAVYKAGWDRSSSGVSWRPSIHMPRWASRITLRITDIRVERLQSVSHEDCEAEGCPGGHGSIPGYPYSATPREHFQTLWNKINGPGAWDENPWVWVVSFERVKP
jgi:hypothetical protein